MFKVLTLNNISAKGLDRFPRDLYEIAAGITQPDLLLLRSFNMHDMPIPDELVAVGRAGAGTNNIPVDKLSAAGIPVFNTPGANANAVKELVVAAMLVTCRNLRSAWEYVDSLTGDNAAINEQVEAGKKQFTGFELPGRTLGVIGLGAIGVQVANAAQALGMRVLGYDPTITVERAWQLSAGVESAASLEDLLARVDFVTFHVPLIDATRGMINRERLKIMRDNVVVLNFARRGIVDEEAVLEAIEAGKVHSYVCDFPSSALVGRRGVLAFPHLGASTREAEENCAVMVADQARDYLEHGNIRNAVNFPEVNLPRRGHRLSVVNANVPDMVAKISHDLGKAGVNIEHMINDSRGELAYTMLDTETEVAAEIVDGIAKLEGVLKVRRLNPPG